MKSRGVRDLKKELQVQNAIYQHDLYHHCIDDMLKSSLTAMIAVMDMRGYSKKYIQKWFKDFLLIIETPEALGVKLESDILMQQFSAKYDLDFSRVKANVETVDEYRKRYKI